MKTFKARRFFAWILACVIACTNVEIIPVFAADSGDTAETILLETDFSNGSLSTYDMAQHGNGNGGTVSWNDPDDEPVQGRCLLIYVNGDTYTEPATKRISKKITGLTSDISNLTIEMKVKTIGEATGKIGLSGSTSNKDILWQGDTGGEWIPIKFELVIGENITSTTYVDNGNGYEKCSGYENKTLETTIANETIYLILHHTGIVQGQSIRFDDMKIYYTMPTVPPTTPNVKTEEVSIFEQDFEDENITTVKEAGLSATRASSGTGIIEIISNSNNTNRWLHLSSSGSDSSCVGTKINLENLLNFTIEFDVQSYGDTVGSFSYKGDSWTSLWNDDKNDKVADEVPAKVKFDFIIDRSGESPSITYNTSVNGSEIASNKTCTYPTDHQFSVRFGNNPKVAGSGQYYDNMKIYGTRIVSEEEPTPLPDPEEENVSIFEQDFEAESVTDVKTAGLKATLTNASTSIVEVISNSEGTNKQLHLSVSDSEAPDTQDYSFAGLAISLINFVKLTIEFDVQSYGDTVGCISYINKNDAAEILWRDDKDNKVAADAPAKVKLDFTISNDGDNTSITYNTSVNGTPVATNQTGTLYTEGKITIRIGNNVKVVGSGQYYDNIKIYGTRIADETNPLLGDQQINWNMVLPSQEKINADGTLTSDSYVENLVEAHPRIFVSSWQEIIDKIENIGEAAQWYEGIKANADNYLETPAVARNVNNRGNVLESARGGKKRLITLAFVYNVEKLKGNVNASSYLEKAYAEMIEMGTWEDWSQFKYYLVTAELMFGYACAYDWLYDGLTEDQKTEIVNIIKKHGLPDLIYNYEGVQTSTNFTTTTINWNPLCNASAMATAFAIADEQPLVAEYILERAPEFIINALEPYQPQGAYPEGIGYWELGTTWLVYAMNLLDNGFKADYKLPEKYYYYNTELYPGLADTCDFAIYYSGPAGQFNYGDCAAGTVSTNAFYWMANKFNKPQYTWYENNLQLSTGEYLSEVNAVAAICFYDPDNTGVGEFALDKFYQSDKDVNGISMRSSWENDDALYAAMQGGNNNENHQHYSLGTYVIDHNGQRFVRQLGEYDYSLKGGKASIYYKRAEGSNTLVINPTAEGEQLSNGVATLIASGTSDNTAFGILDMSKAYTAGSAKITSAKRGMMLTDNRNRVIVQDEVELSEASEFYWFANTDANITIAEDGKSVLLEMDGERMLVRIIEGPEDAVFGVMDRVSLIENVQNTVTSGTKLYIHVENVQNLNLAVEYVALEEGEGIPTAWQYVPMAQWTAEENQTTEVGFELKVTVNGDEMTFFDTKREEYVLNVDSLSAAIPQIGAEVISGTGSVAVTQAATVGGSATVIVTADGETYTYTIKIEVDPFANVESMDVLTGVHVTVEDTPVTAPDYNTFIYVESLESIGWRNYPERGVVDGVISSETGDQHRWSYPGDNRWIILDFGKVYNLHSMGFNGDKQDERAYDFHVEVSVDKENWTTIYEDGAPKTTNTMSIIALGDVEARYVKVVGHGYNGKTSGYNTWRELRFYESKAQQQEDMIHWPIYFGGSSVAGTVGQTKDLIIQGVNEASKFFALSKNAEVTCEIADESIAVVADGKITFNKAGTTTMVVSAGQYGFTAEVTLSVVSLEEIIEPETPTPTPTPTTAPTATPSAKPEVSPSATPTPTPTPEATEAPTASPEVVYLEILTEGTDTSYMPGSAGDIVKIHCTGELQEFVSAELDGQVIEEKNYTLEEGSTIIVFKTDYLETLSVGDHEVTLNYTGDRRIETVLTIYAGVPEADSDSEPEEKSDSTGAVESVEGTPEDSAKVETTPTGDNNNFYVWICLLIISLMSVFSLLVLNKQKSEN